MNSLLDAVECVNSSWILSSCLQVMFSSVMRGQYVPHAGLSGYREILE